MGESSILLVTTSVVVPGITEVMEVFCPVIMFRRLDFPVLVLPQIPIRNSSELGVFCIPVPCVIGA